MSTGELVVIELALFGWEWRRNRTRGSNEALSKRLMFPDVEDRPEAVCQVECSHIT
jgi:hypothetical protein